MIFIIVPKKIILASKSAARKSIFANLGINAEIYITDADEELEEELSPEEIVRELSLRKARIAKEQIGDPNILIIAADTVVEYDGKIIGKPKDAEDAARTLSMLSGNFHRVYSGITIILGSFEACDHDVTKVKFRDMDIREIEQYIKIGDPLTKAGAYGAEGPGAAFIEHIEGDFFNIAGLPIFKFANMLKTSFGLTVFDLPTQDLPERSR